MKLLREGLLLFSLYIFGTLLGLAVSGAFFIYLAMSWLQQPQRADNQNVRQLLDWGRSYAIELNQLDALHKSSQFQFSSLCSSVCQTSFINTDQLLEQGVPYLVRYWEGQKGLALKDPYFSLALAKAELLTFLYPDFLRSAVLEPLPDSRFWRIVNAFKLEWRLFRHLSSLYVHRDDLLQKWNTLHNFQELHLSCKSQGRGTPEVIQRCQSGAP